MALEAARMHAGAGRLKDALRTLRDIKEYEEGRLPRNSSLDKANN